MSPFSKDAHSDVLQMLVEDMGTLLAHRLQDRFAPKPEPAPQAAPPADQSSSSEFSDADLTSLASQYEALPSE